MRKGKEEPIEHTQCQGALDTVPNSLRDDLRNQLTVNVSEPHVSTVIAIGQIRVVHTEQMQHRRMEIVRRYTLFRGLVAELVTRADDLPALDPRSRHPACHRARIVITAHPTL